MADMTHPTYHPHPPAWRQSATHHAMRLIAARRIPTLSEPDGMPMRDQTTLDLELDKFSRDDDPTISLSIAQLMEWRRRKTGRRLWLPPIQRSLVWTNEQIINYWDSLLRGYPPGLMMVHEAHSTPLKPDQGYDTDGNPDHPDAGDYQLFDGQQRMAALLLGIGEGPLHRHLRLWIDLADPRTPGSDLKFQLRITSTGQPFGYKPDAPNQKFDLGTRHEKWAEWKEAGKVDEAAFQSVTGSDLIGQQHALSLPEVIRGILPEECGRNTGDRSLTLPESAQTEAFRAALQKALNSRLIVHRVPAEIVNDPEEYVRFFRRLGQGGTRLSNDELTYSIIKHAFPEIRSTMESIVKGPGRFAGEVDLALAAMRAAKALHTDENAKGWEAIGRPDPSFATRLRAERCLETIRSAFCRMVVDPSPTLTQTLTRLRAALEYDAQEHARGLPAILLARLPTELLDVLILFDEKRRLAAPSGEDRQAWGEQDRDTLTAFALHWLLFVGNDSKAAWHAFERVIEPGWSWSLASIRALVEHYEQEGIARHAPGEQALGELRKGIAAKRGGHRLRTWSERFSEIDETPGGGEALRMLSTHGELVRRALMWLQRAYLTRKYPQYDPISGKDEDLPVDLDHIVPRSIFGSRWNDAQHRVSGIPDSADNFRWQRDLIGNSLGNFRWLDARENRGRGNRRFVPLGDDQDVLGNHGDGEAAAQWNSIIPDEGDTGWKWSPQNVGEFQYLIDTRSLYLYERLIKDSGIGSIIPGWDNVS